MKMRKMKTCLLEHGQKFADINCQAFHSNRLSSNRISFARMLGHDCIQLYTFSIAGSLRNILKFHDISLRYFYIPGQWTMIFLGFASSRDCKGKMKGGSVKTYYFYTKFHMYI